MYSCVIAVAVIVVAVVVVVVTLVVVVVVVDCYPVSRRTAAIELI